MSASSATDPAPTSTLSAGDPESSGSDSAVSVLVVGLGSIGKRHLRCLKSLGVRDLRAFRPVGRRPLEDGVADELRFHTDLNEALTDPPDAVIIANPTAMHLEVANAAIEAGCHLLIEKPISHSTVGVRELGRRADLLGRIVTVGYQTRFHPGFTRIRELLEAGSIGRPLSVRAEVGQYLPDWHPWEDYRYGVSARADLGGGALLDLSHELDYVTALFGRAHWVTGFVGRVSALELETEDVAELVLACEKVPVVSIHLDYLQRTPTRSCHIIGETGSIRWDYLAARVELLLANGTTSVYEAPDFERHDMYMAQMRSFLSGVAGRSTPEVSVEDALHVVEVIEAAHRAAATGEQQKVNR